MWSCLLWDCCYWPVVLQFFKGKLSHSGVVHCWKKGWDPKESDAQEIKMAYVQCFLHHNSKGPHVIHYRMRGNGLKLCQGRLRFCIRNSFYSKRAVMQWHSCPGRWWGHRPWRCPRAMEMWYWGMWSVGMVGWVGVGLGELGGLFQPSWFYDSKQKTKQHTNKYKCYKTKPLFSIENNPQAHRSLGPASCQVCHFRPVLPKQEVF